MLTPVPAAYLLWRCGQHPERLIFEIAQGEIGKFVLVFSARVW